MHTPPAASTAMGLQPHITRGLNITFKNELCIKASDLGTKTETFITYQANKNVCACVHIWIPSCHATGYALRAIPPLCSAASSLTWRREDDCRNAGCSGEQLESPELGFDKKLAGVSEDTLVISGWGLCKRIVMGSAGLRPILCSLCRESGWSSRQEPWPLDPVL